MKDEKSENGERRVANAGVGCRLRLLILSILIHEG